MCMGVGCVCMQVGLRTHQGMNVVEQRTPPSLAAALSLTILLPNLIPSDKFQKLIS